MARPKVLVLVGGAHYHDAPEHRPLIQGLIAESGKFDVTMTDDLGVLTQASLADYAAIVNYTTFLEPPPEQVAPLIAAVDSGKGYLALHSGTATFWSSPAYLEMIGCRFLSHPPIKRFAVKIHDRTHPITAGVDDFDTVDELFILGYNSADFVTLAAELAKGRPRSELRELGAGPLPADVRLLASAEGHPMVYTRTFGKGKVYVNGLGHDGRTINHPAFRRLISQGLDWLVSA